MAKKPCDHDPDDAPRGRFQPGRSGNPNGRPRKSTRTDAAEARADAARADGWASLLNGLGNSLYDKRLSVQFGSVCPVNDETARALWRGNDLAKKIIEKLPKHEIRAGFEIKIKEDDSAEGDGAESDTEDLYADARERGTGATRRDLQVTQAPIGKPDPEIAAAKEAAAAKRTAERKQSENASDRASKVHQIWKRLDLLKKVRQARCYQRAYGGAAILIGAIDNGAPDQPLALERVRELNYLTVLEPREIQPLAYYGDPLSPKFGEVEIWGIMPHSPGPMQAATIAIPRLIRVHESRLIILRGTVVSRQVSHGTMQGWGDSVLTPVYEVLRDFGIGWSAAGVLMTDFSQAVYKMSGLASLLSADNADDFAERMRNMERGRSIARVTIIDAQDEFERKATPMSGLPELLDRYQARVAAAAEMPVTEVFGESATGLNATGEGDRKSWHAEVSASCEEHVIPALERITEIALQVTGGVPDSWEVCAKPLEQESGKERAEREKLEAEADHIRIEDQVVSPEEVCVSRYADGKGALQIDFDAREELVAAAAKPVETEGKDPDLTPPPVIGPGGEEIPAGATVMREPKPAPAANKPPVPKR